MQKIGIPTRTVIPNAHTSEIFVCADGGAFGSSGSGWGLKISSTAIQRRVPVFVVAVMVRAGMRDMPKSARRGTPVGVQRMFS